MKKLLKAFVLMTLFLLSSSIIYGTPSTCINISIDRDGILLQGKFYIADGKGPFATVLLLQGFPGNNKDVLGLGNEMSAAGINALTFNYSGTHQSQGTFNLENSLKDISATFEFINQPETVKKFQIDNTRIYLAGYSYGGAMAMTYVATHPEIRRVISIAGNDHGAFMEAYNHNPKMRQMIDEMFIRFAPPTGNIRFAPGGTPREMAEMKIVESNSAHDLRKSVNLLADKDILLIAGWDDHNVSLDYIILPLYRTLQKAGAKNVKITAFQDGHSFRNSRDKLARLIIKWIIDQHSPPSGLQSPKSGSTSGSTERRSSSSWFNIQS